jgi:hypothetical protein
MSSAVITVGVDPGLSGAIALVESDGTLVDAYDMPIVGGQVSAHLLAGLEPWNHPDQPFGTVVIEDVHAMPKQGVTSSFNFGRSKGVVEGVFAGAGRPIEYVAPATWKRALHLSKDKGASRRRAIELWPDHSDKFKRVKDDGRAEAALIALWYVTKGQAA